MHTSAAIFAFGGSALFATSFYVVQRTCRARLFGGEALANFIFWGYQFFIVMAALSYVMGFSKSQEYAEPEWHIDLWLTVVWVLYAVVFIGTLLKRARAAHLRRQLVLHRVHPDRSPCCTSATTSACRSRRTARRAIRCSPACRTR